MRKILAVVLFLIAAFFGAGTQSDLYGDISLFLIIVIIVASLSVMSYAVTLWKSSKGDEMDTNE